MPTPPLLPTELARRLDGRVEARTEPVRVRWDLAELVTADGHRLRSGFVCSVRVLEAATERKMLAEAFLSGRNSLGVEDLVNHFTPALQDAAAKAAAAQSATDLFGDVKQETPTDAAKVATKNAKDAIIEGLRKAGEAVAFTCGVELLAPFQLDVESPSFQQQRIEAMERSLAERRVAGQVEHFERAAALLKQFEGIRQSAPHLSPGAVLEQISASDRGSMLQTLLLAASKEGRAQALWNVAGPCLVKIDPRANPPKLDLTPLPTTLGPLRSVQAANLDGQRVLLVGARSGVMVVRLESPADDVQCYVDPELVTQLGFSGAVLWNGKLVACHGDGGLVCWQLGQTAAPVQSLRPANLGGAPQPVAPSLLASSSQTQRLPGARNVTVLDDARLLFSVGDRLVVLDAAGALLPVPSQEAGEVLAILASEKHVTAVRENGTVTVHDRTTLRATSSDCRCGRVAAAGILPWLGSVRLLLATEDGPVQCMGLEDALVTQYVSNHRGLRAIAATADLVVGVSADRQRLVLWQTCDGRKPIAEIAIASIAKHRVADVEFA